MTTDGPPPGDDPLGLLGASNAPVSEYLLGVMRREVLTPPDTAHVALAGQGIDPVLRYRGCHRYDDLVAGPLRDHNPGDDDRLRAALAARFELRRRWAHVAAGSPRHARDGV
jgi:hypothetical protein